MIYTDENRLRQSLIDDLESKYDIIDCFDFINHDSNPLAFYHWCEYWSDHSFAANERIVILNCDTDYYPSSTVGNNNWNFFSCCQHFGLPVEFFIYCSTSYGIHREVFELCDKFNLSQPTVLETAFMPWLVPTENVVDVPYNPSTVSRLYICINGAQRTHRLMLLSYLKEYNLLDRGYVAYNFANRPFEPTAEIDYPPADMILRTTVPFTRINDFYMKSNLDLMVYLKNNSSFNGQTQQLGIYGIEDAGVSLASYNEFFPPCLQQALIYLVTETVFCYPYPFITEKTFKAILNKRPFILVGSPGTVQKLRDLGFKTFNDFWDESYDSIVNPSDRMQAIVNIIKQLSALRSADLQYLALRIQNAVEYNYQHYVNNFINDAHV